MAKASDNVFPRVIYGMNTADQAAPADSSWRVYSKANGIFARSSNTVVGPFAAAAGSGNVATDTIWDAAGDLAVGTGADTAAKLAKGSAGAVLAMSNGAVAWNAGTSFPVSPATNDRYYRTDRALEYYYDGTRWLTTVEYAETFVIQQVIPPFSANGTGLFILDIPLANLYDVWMSTLSWSSRNQGTVDGSNFWTITLNKVTGNFTATSITTDVTSPDTSNAVTAHRKTIGALLGTSSGGLTIDLTKTGSTGNLSHLAISLRYRLVG